MVYIELDYKSCGHFMYSRLTLIPGKLGSKQCNIECKINFPISDCGEICFLTLPFNIFIMYILVVYCCSKHYPAPIYLVKHLEI